jgi:ureidoacrylate peracid hydrolase
MQNAFVARGATYECPPARDIIPAINRLAGSLREAGGEIVWLMSTPGDWKVFFDNFENPNRQKAGREALADGSWGHAFYPGLDIKPSDRIVKKKRFSASIQGSSDLDAILRARGIDAVLITGAATNGCCESTARDAMMLDYKVIMLSDACAPFNDENHLNGLWTVFRAFGDVRTTDETIALIEAGKVRRAAE